MRKKLSVIFYIVVVIVGIQGSSSGQVLAVDNSNKENLVLYLDNNKIQAQNLRQLFANISLSYDIPIGFVVSSKGDQIPVSFDLKTGTISDLLTKIVDQFDDYTWETRDGVINVFPKKMYQNTIVNELLDTSVDSFSIKQNSSCQTVVKSLLSVPEIRKVLEANSLSYQKQNHIGFYIQQTGKRYSLKVSNVKLLEILNKVAKESPTTKYWFINGNKSNKQILELGFIARFEDASNSVVLDKKH